MEKYLHKIDFNEILNPLEYSKINKTSEEIAAEFILKLRQKQQVDLKELYTIQPGKKLDLKKNRIIPLKSSNFNELINGGFQEDRIYLLYGRYASGKSQICHHICVSLYNLCDKDEEKPEILFIDTEDTFRPERIIQISKSYEFDGKELLKHINVINISSTEKMNFFFSRLDKQGLPKNVRLIIIDSFTNWVRVELGDQESSTQKVRDNLISILEKLHRFKKTHKIPIVLTSQVRGIGSETSGFNVKPVMEYVLNEYIDESILLSRTDDDKKFAFLVNSKDLQENNIQFELSVEGVVDP